MFYFDREAARLMDLGQRLSRFKLRAEIDLGIANMAYVLYGNDAGAAMGLICNWSCTMWNDGVVYYDPRTTEAGCRAILPKPVR